VAQRAARRGPASPPGRGCPGPQEAAETSEQAAALAALVAQLPVHLRGPVVLRHVVGLSYAETAAALRCPEGTAKANVARGLARLRQLATSEAASPRDPAPRAETRRSAPRRARKESR
jgi:RNA polymerase sigma-70 factor, ECF subfamily